MINMTEWFNGLLFVLVDLLGIILPSYMGIVVNHYGELGGGNSNIFDFHPDPWGDLIRTVAYFSNGWQETTTKIDLCSFPVTLW